MFEYFDHTADIGIRLTAGDLPRLFSEAGRALFGAIVASPDAIRPRKREQIALREGDIELLLRDWMAELLYLFEVERLVFCEFSVQIRGEELRGEATGELFDAERHGLGHEVKAVTYHGLQLTEQASGDWIAEIILDI